MEKSLIYKVIRILLAAALLAVAMLAERNNAWTAWQLLPLYLVPYLLAGGGVLAEAAEKIVHGDLLDEDFLMSVATLGALGIGFLPDTPHQFPEAVFVMIFYQIGELFEEIGAGRSRKSIAQLMEIRPDAANRERDGRVETVDPKEVQVGEILVVKPGEKVPMDGVVVSGETSLDTVALTGESLPREAVCGDPVYSGCVNLSGMIRMRVTKPFGESTASKILELVEHAGEHKSRSERFITRFARIYTPFVVSAAVVLALLPPLLSGRFVADFPVWLYRALTFLIVSCPCALVISVPLAFFGGIGGASRKGILVKGADALEAFAKVRTVVFDKTGTLTKGIFSVTAVHPQKLDARQLLHLAAHVERYSIHPVAAALRNAYPEESDGCRVEAVEEIAGQGVKALVNGRQVCVGNQRLMEAAGAAWKPCSREGTILHVCVEGEYAGHIVISDQLKPDAREAVDALRRAGVTRTVMLTGDREETAAAVARAVGVDAFHAGLLPADKLAAVEELLLNMPAASKLAFVGDGINDAPVLARADVGIAMGGLGADAAIEAADVVLMDDRPSKMVPGMAIARKTLRVAKQNIAFALLVKFLVLGLAAFGLATMAMAVFADVGVTVLAVVNAMRSGHVIES